MLSQAARMNIEFTPEMTPQQRAEAVRQRMREMVDAEAQRRANAGEDRDELLRDAGAMGGMFGGPGGGRGRGEGAEGLGTKAHSRFGEFVETFTELVCTARPALRGARS